MNVQAGARHFHGHFALVFRMRAAHSQLRGLKVRPRGRGHEMGLRDVAITDLLIFHAAIAKVAGASLKNKNWRGATFV
jgi:hypothetical protein